MAGKLFDLAKRDSKFFITKGGFQEDITLETPSGDKVVNITGFATKHHISFDTDGSPINAKNVHISISESDLTTLSYPIRNSREEVFLKGHKVFFKDSSGVVKKYIVNECFPDETLGLIVLILGDFRL